MKKLFALISAFCLLLTISSATIFAGQAVRVSVDGKWLSFDQEPIIENDRTLVPVRAIFESLGAEVDWDGSTQIVSARKDNDLILLKINQPIMTKNKEVLLLDVAPKIVNDRTLVPLRAISECFGASVSWLDTEKLVEIITNGAASPSPTPEVKPTSTPEPTGVPTSSPKPTQVPEPTQKPAPTQTPKPTAQPTSQPTATPAPPSNDASGFEQQVLTLVNQERQANGLSPLTWNSSLANVARAHSKDMNDRKFMSHTNPDGLSPFDRMKNAGISYRSAAENIAAGQTTPQSVMNSWMNSAGHRANILSANVTELGVGYYKGNGSYTHYWTQLFMSR